MVLADNSELAISVELPFQRKIAIGTKLLLAMQFFAASES